RSIFGLLAASSAISWRSPSDSDRVLRLRSVLTKLVSLARVAASAGCCGPVERPRVAPGFGFRASRILSAETVSPAAARPAVIDSAALIVMIERKRFIVLILAVNALQTGVHDVLMLRR